MDNEYRKIIDSYKNLDDMPTLHELAENFVDIYNYHIDVEHAAVIKFRMFDTPTWACIYQADIEMQEMFSRIPEGRRGDYLRYFTERAFAKFIKLLEKADMDGYYPNDLIVERADDTVYLYVQWTINGTSPSWDDASYGDVYRRGQKQTCLNTEDFFTDEIKKAIEED